jgi:hypothetical protein
LTYTNTLREMRMLINSAVIALTRQGPTWNFPAVLALS